MDGEPLKTADAVSLTCKEEEEEDDAAPKAEPVDARGSSTVSEEAECTCGLEDERADAAGFDIATEVVGVVAPSSSSVVSGAGSAGFQTPSEKGSLQGSSFEPPESVRKWLSPEEWETLRHVWNDTETRAMLWADGELDDLGLWDWEDDGAGSGLPRDVPGRSGLQPPGGCAPRKKARRKRQWNDRFSSVPNDHRFPAPLRRYFDALPSETSPPKQNPYQSLPSLSSHEFSGSLSTDPHSSTRLRPVWIDNWSQLASRDNDGIHPHLRHYFDRRGFETSFRQRPHCDSPWNQSMRPRTPQRPPVEELVSRHSRSLPSLAPSSVGSEEIDVKKRGAGSISWGRRCLVYGRDREVNVKDRKRIPWVGDHHLSESEDNAILNPLLRHYFDSDGLEASFRNRGRHYNRPAKSVFGINMNSTSSSGNGSSCNR